MAMPVLKIEAETVAEAWEEAVAQVWRGGVRKATQYPLQKGGDFAPQESRAATAVIVIQNPLKEPRVHAGDAMAQQAIKGGYIDEVLEGVKDHLIREGGWDYTYHERLFNYKIPTIPPLDQIQRIKNMLAEGELYSRRLQAVTWQAWKDLYSDNPPCFQRLWVVVPTLDPKPKPSTTYKVNFQTTWRSRDLFDAWGANVNAMIELCRRKIVEPLSREFEGEGVRFEVGQYVDFSNDLHIYEKDYGEVERFLATLEKKRSQKKDLGKVRQGPTFEALLNLGKREKSP